MVAREHGAVRKKCFGCLRIALLYPSIYRAAVASLAFQNLYYMLNSFEHVVAERFVARKLSGFEEPPRSLESGASLASFDAIFIPISFEIDYSTMVRLLAAGGIPPLREKRWREKKFPLIVVGGPVPSMNPSIAKEIADVVIVGEAEPLVPLLVETLAEQGSSGVLEHLACRPGVLVDGCEKVPRVYVSDLNDAFHSVVQFRIPGSGDPWGEAYMVEISRGCPHMCRFCMPAYFSHPVRHRSLKLILDLIDRGVLANRVSRVAFYSLSFFDHPSADKLLESVLEKGLSASIGSMRGDQLNEERIKVLSRLGQRVVTVAPETFSSRLCSKIGKCVSADRVEEIAHYAWSKGMHLKLYIMVGFPGEKLDDISDTISAIERIAGKQKRPWALRLSINPLIPKPWTPLQYARFIDEDDYVSKVRAFKKSLEPRAVKVEYLSYRYALVEAIIARGSSRLAEALVEWGVSGGRLGSFFSILRKRGESLEKLMGFEEDRAEWLKLVSPGYTSASLKTSWQQFYKPA